MNEFQLETSRLFWLLAAVVAEYVLVTAAVAADLLSGLRKSHREGRKMRSRGLRRTIDKLARYYNVLAMLTIVDAMQLTAAMFLRSVEGYDVPTIPVFTMVGSLALAAIEVKSYYENCERKEGRHRAAAADGGGNSQ